MSTPAPAPGATGSYTSPGDQIAQRAGTSLSSGTAGQAVPEKSDFPYGPLAGIMGSQIALGYRPGQTPMLPSTVSSRDLKAAYYSWDDKYRGQFRNKLALIDKNWSTATDEELQKKWDSLVDQSSSYLQAGNSLSPWDILNRDVTAVGQSLAAAKPTTQTLTSTAANYTGALDSEALFTQAAQSLLGRKPTADEVAQFQGLLRSNEAANPVTTVTTRTTSASGQTVNESSAQTGGLSADARALLAQKQAEGSTDYAEHQAATTLMGWLAGATSGG